MGFASPVLPVLSRIHEITSRFDAGAPTAAGPSSFAGVLDQQLGRAGEAVSTPGAAGDLAGAMAGSDAAASDAALLAVRRADVCSCSDQDEVGSNAMNDVTAGSAPATSDTPETPDDRGPVSSVAGFAGAAPYEALFEAAGARYGVDPKLLASVARTESNFRPEARSSAGAIGLMQFMPATARGLGIDPTDPAQAIDGAARYLRGQLDRFGSLELAVAAYNAGPGAVSRFGGIPPYAETRSYVTKVLGSYRALA